MIWSVLRAHAKKMCIVKLFSIVGYSWSRGCEGPRNDWMFSTPLGSDPLTERSKRRICCRRLDQHYVTPCYLVLGNDTAVGRLLLVQPRLPKDLWPASWNPIKSWHYDSVWWAQNFAILLSFCKGTWSNSLDNKAFRGQHPSAPRSVNE